MRAGRNAHPHLESRLARLLYFGTWLASISMGLGLLLYLVFGRGPSPRQASLSNLADLLMNLGIASFILLPVARVAFMLIVFARRRDYRFVAISALVLLIIAASMLLGFFTSKVAG